MTTTAVASASAASKMMMVTAANGYDVSSGDRGGNGWSITSAHCDRDAQIGGTTWSERWAINVIARYYSATTIAIDDD